MVLSRRGTLAAAAVAVLAACSVVGDGDGGELPEPVTPGAEWEEASPDDLGLDAEVLDDLAARAETADSDCLIVVRNGRVAGEWYWRGTGPSTDHEVYSVTKSLAATLVGIAVDDGDLDLDDRASEYIPEWKGTASEPVTVRQLLSMDSGRERDLDTDYLTLIAAPDRTRYAVGLDQTYPPGEAWAYNNSGVQALRAVLLAATGVEPADYARDRLFEPIGMDDTELTEDRSGGTTLAFGARSTCRDLARFGWLMASGGDWDGSAVLTEDWVEAATTPSTDLNEGYGLLWWLNRAGRIVPSELAVSLASDDTPTEGQVVAGAPESLYWALGLGNQIVQVDPASGTVLVRIGPGEVPFGPEPFDPGDAARLVTDGLVS